jgi:hypothetical protein
MQRAAELLGIILNVAFVFASVSYAATSLADALGGLMGWRAKLLLENLKDLLDDPQFEGLTLALYNNINFNPVSKGDVHSEAELPSWTSLPPAADPAVFALAIVEVLGLEQIATDELNKNPPKFEDFKKDAQKAFAPPGKDRAAPPGTIQTPDPTTGGRLTIPISPRVRALVYDLVVRTTNDSDLPEPKSTADADVARAARVAIPQALVAMMKEIAGWFTYSQLFSREDYRRRTRWVTVLFAFAIAVALDLQPLPIGGESLAGKVPYGVSVLQWALVGLSALFGASAWYTFVQWLLNAGVTPAKPDAGLAGSAAQKGPAPSSELSASGRTGPDGAGGGAGGSGGGARGSGGGSGTESGGAGGGATAGAGAAGAGAAGAGAAGAGVAGVGPAGASGPVRPAPDEPG